MQQHGVVAGLGDRQVEARVGGTLFRADLVVARIAGLERLEGLGQALVIEGGRTQRRVVGTGPFQRVAKLQQVALGLRVTLQQVQSP